MMTRLPVRCLMRTGKSPLIFNAHMFKLFILRFRFHVFSSFDTTPSALHPDHNSAAALNLNLIDSGPHEELETTP